MLSTVIPLKIASILVLMLGGGKYIRLKHHPQPILAKKIGVQFVTDARNIESSNVTASVLTIMILRGKN